MLWPTRWKVSADSLANIVDNYNLLQRTWKAVELAGNTEMKARINGVVAHMKTFNFIFGTILGEMLLCHTNNLNQTLQKKTISTAESQQVGRTVITTLFILQTEKMFNLFWKKSATVAKSVDVGELEVLRKRKMPKHYDDGSATDTFHDSP